MKQREADCLAGLAVENRAREDGIREDGIRQSCAVVLLEAGTTVLKVAEEEQTSQPSRKIGAGYRQRGGVAAARGQTIAPTKGGLRLMESVKALVVVRKKKAQPVKEADKITAAVVPS